MLFTCFVWSSTKDSNFTWANAGATVFGAPATKAKNSEAASDEEEAPDNVDIHFEPIVSLPEVPSHIDIQRFKKKKKGQRCGFIKALSYLPGGDQIRRRGRGDPVQGAH